MRNGLYPKLAWQNIRQNRRFFVPYLLALIGLSAAFYVMSALVLDPGVDSMRGAEYVKVMMGMGMFIAGIFSAVLLLYINSFLMKQRKKELADSIIQDGDAALLRLTKDELMRLICG